MHTHLYVYTQNYNILSLYLSRSPSFSILYICVRRCVFVISIYIQTTTCISHYYNILSRSLSVAIYIYTYYIYGYEGMNKYMNT